MLLAHSVGQGLSRTPQRRSWDFPPDAPPSPPGFTALETSCGGSARIAEKASSSCDADGAIERSRGGSVPCRGCSHPNVGRSRPKLERARPILEQMRLIVQRARPQFNIEIWGGPHVRPKLGASCGMESAKFGTASTCASMFLYPPNHHGCVECARKHARNKCHAPMLRATHMCIAQCPAANTPVVPPFATPGIPGETWATPFRTNRGWHS